MSQCEDILRLTKKGWVSQLEAFKQGCGMRLAARILDLKDKGYNFQDRWVVVGNKRFKEYRFTSQVSE